MLRARWELDGPNVGGEEGVLIWMQTSQCENCVDRPLGAGVPLQRSKRP